MSFIDIRKLIEAKEKGIELKKVSDTLIDFEGRSMKVEVYTDGAVSLYKCPRCKLFFATVKDLKIHLEWHRATGRTD